MKQKCKECGKLHDADVKVCSCGSKEFVSADEKSLEEQIGAILPELEAVKGIMETADKDHETVEANKKTVAGIVEQLTALEKSVTETSQKLITVGKRRIEVVESGLDLDQKKDFNSFFALISKQTRQPSDENATKLFELQQKYSEKDLNTGTDADGGYLVPEPFRDKIWRIAAQASVALRECVVTPLTVGNKLPTLALGTNVAVVWTDEGVNFTESNPTFTKSTVTAKKLAAFSEMTNELLEDEAVGVVDLIITLYGEVMGEEIDNQAFNGDGTVFTGILNASGVNTVTMAVASAFSDMDQDDLSDMIAQIKESVIANAKFYMHRTIFNHVRKLKDTDGNPIYWPPQGTNPATIYGFPVVLVEKMPSNSASAAATPFVIFGNLKNYQIGTKGDMDVVVTGEGRTLTIADKKIVAVRRRMAMDMGLAGAISVLKTGAAS